MGGLQQGLFVALVWFFLSFCVCFGGCMWVHDFCMRAGGLWLYGWVGQLASIRRCFSWALASCTRRRMRHELRPLASVACRGCGGNTAWTWLGVVLLCWPVLCLVCSALAAACPALLVSSALCVLPSVCLCRSQRPSLVVTPEAAVLPCRLACWGAPYLLHGVRPLGGRSLASCMRLVSERACRPPLAL
jgi:hypothetical protein